MIPVPDTSDWSDRRHAVRRVLSRLVPRVVSEYPFEVYVSIAALFIGVSVLVGLATAPSLNMIIPFAALIAWGISLVLGSITVSVSLLRRHAGGLASGHQLLGTAMITYAIALMVSTGFAAAATSITLFMLAGVLCWIRSLYFRRLLDIKLGARRLSEQS